MTFENIRDVILARELEREQEIDRIKAVRYNKSYEDAKRLVAYLGMKEKDIPYIMRLFRTFGKEKVLSLESWAKDIRNPRENIRGLLYWKLKTDGQLSLLER